MKRLFLLLILVCIAVPSYGWEYQNKEATPIFGAEVVETEISDYHIDQAPLGGNWNDGAMTYSNLYVDMASKIYAPGVAEGFAVYLISVRVKIKVQDGRGQYKEYYRYGERMGSCEIKNEFCWDIVKDIKVDVYKEGWSTYDVGHLSSQAVVTKFDFANATMLPDEKFCHDKNHECDALVGCPIHDGFDEEDTDEEDTYNRGGTMWDEVFKDTIDN